MKKFLASALMLLAASTATFAQHAEGTWTIQPKAGINIANLTKSPGADSRVGFVGGAEVEYQATDIFSISGGVLYSQQGHKWNDAGLDYTTRMDYINIPILANVYVVKGLAVKAGIQPGFNVNAQEKVSGNGHSATSDVNTNKTFDFTIPVGLSYEFSGVPIVIDARYNWGLTKAFKDSDAKNSVFQLTLGYKFEL